MAHVDDQDLERATPLSDDAALSKKGTRQDSKGDGEAEGSSSLPEWPSKCAFSVKGYVIDPWAILKYLCWDIWSPTDIIRLIWDTWMFGLLIYVMLCVPYIVAFRIPTDILNSPLARFDFSVNMFFLFDVLLNFRTAYADHNGQLVFDRKKIAVTYLKGWFLIDVLTSMPWDNIFGSGFGLLKVLRMFRLTRFIKVKQLFRAIKVQRVKRIRKFFRVFDQLTDHQIMRMIVFGLVAAVLVHWVACVWYLTAAAYPEGTDTWLTETFGDSLDTTDNLVRYITAVYWSVTTMTTVGYGDVTPVQVAEKCVAIVCMVMGASVFAYFMGTMAALVASLSVSDARTTRKKAEIKEFIQRRKIPPNLGGKITDFYTFTLSRELHDEEADIVVGLPSHLRMQVIWHLYQDALEKVPFFQGKHPQFITALVGYLKLEFYAPDDIVISQGHKGNEMYFVGSGAVEVRVYDLLHAEQNDLSCEADVRVKSKRHAHPPLMRAPVKKAISWLTGQGNKNHASRRLPYEDLKKLPYKLIAQLGEGQFFGEIACLEGQPYLATVVAAEYTELYSLSRRDLEQVVMEYQEYAEDLLYLFQEQSILPHVMEVREEMGLPRDTPLNLRTRTDSAHPSRMAFSVTTPAGPNEPSSHDLRAVSTPVGYGPFGGPTNTASPHAGAHSNSGELHTTSTGLAQASSGGVGADAIASAARKLIGMQSVARQSAFYRHTLHPLDESSAVTLPVVEAHSMPPPAVALGSIGPEQGAGSDGAQTAWQAPCVCPHCAHCRSLPGAFEVLGTPIATRRRAASQPDLAALASLSSGSVSNVGVGSIKDRYFSAGGRVSSSAADTAPEGADAAIAASVGGRGASGTELGRALSRARLHQGSSTAKPLGGQSSGGKLGTRLAARSVTAPYSPFAVPGEPSSGHGAPSRTLHSTLARLSRSSQTSIELNRTTHGSQNVATQYGSGDVTTEPLAAVSTAASGAGELVGDGVSFSQGMGPDVGTGQVEHGGVGQGEGGGQVTHGDAEQHVDEPHVGRQASLSMGRQASLARSSAPAAAAAAVAPSPHEHIVRRAVNVWRGAVARTKSPHHAHAGGDAAAPAQPPRRPPRPPRLDVVAAEAHPSTTSGQSSSSADESENGNRSHGHAARASVLPHRDRRSRLLPGARAPATSRLQTYAPHTPVSAYHRVSTFAHNAVGLARSSVRRIMRQTSLARGGGGDALVLAALAAEQQGASSQARSPLGSGTATHTTHRLHNNNHHADEDAEQSAAHRAQMLRRTQSRR